MIKYAKNLLTPLATLAGSLVFPAVAAAQTTNPDSLVPPALAKNPDIIPIIRAIIQFILVVAFIIAFIMLLIGGIRWILAGGDEKAVAGARNTITAALIGLVIVLVAFAIIKLVETFFGVTIISGPFTIPTVGT
jgi:hypothetical protein